MVWIRCVGWKVIVLTELCVFCMKSWISKQKHIDIFPTFKPLWDEEGWVSPHRWWSHSAYSRCLNMNDIQYASLLRLLIIAHLRFMTYEKMAPMFGSACTWGIVGYNYLLHWIQHIVNWTLQLTNASPFHVFIACADDVRSYQTAKHYHHQHHQQGRSKLSAKCTKWPSTGKDWEAPDAFWWKPGTGTDDRYWPTLNL